jgi:hypothetical protein
VVGLADGNPDLKGQTWESLSVVPYEELVRELRPTLVLVAHHHYQEDILIRLLEVLPPDFPRASIYHPDRLLVPARNPGLASALSPR